MVKNYSDRILFARLCIYHKHKRSDSNTIPPLKADEILHLTQTPMPTF